MCSMFCKPNTALKNSPLLNTKVGRGKITSCCEQSRLESEKYGQTRQRQAREDGSSDQSDYYGEKGEVDRRWH